MDRSKDQCVTPLRKMSLRRKRCNNPEERSESPLHKKTSPPVGNNNIKNVDRISSAGQGVQEKLSQVYYTRRSTLLQSVSPREPPCTPKNQRTTRRRTKSTEKKKDMRLSMLEEQRQDQHSPDTPFISSQLCGTQECEVVWDCNSPGFSKDDLKRMSSTGEKEQMPSPVVFVAPLPSRTLFPKLRPRPLTSVSAVNTTAQLDELLNQVANKAIFTGGVLQGSKREVLAKDSDLPEVSTSSPIAQKFLLAPCSSVDNNSVSCSLDVPDLNGKHSSQPFMVWEGKEPADFDSVTDTHFGNNLADPEEFNNDIWEEDLNEAICNVSGENDSQNVPFEENSEASASNLDGTLVGKTGRRDKSHNSTDMFDDDYFNDSLIRSTQLWEKEILEKDSDTARSFRDKGQVFTRASELDCDSLRKGRRSSLTECISPRLVKESSVTPKNVSEKSLLKRVNEIGVKHNNSESNKTEFSVKSSPVIGKKHASQAGNPQKRRIRNTFRLDSILTINNAKPEITKDTAVQMHDGTESDVNILNSGKGNVSVSIQNSGSGKSDLSKEQPQSLTKTHATEMPKQLKNDTSFLSDRCNKANSSIKSCKKPFSHSEVAGNAKSSIISQPLKSINKEDPHDFEEEDSFFESLLCTIPEEDMLIKKLKALDKSQADDTLKFQSCNKVTNSSISTESNQKFQKNIIDRDARSVSDPANLNQPIPETSNTSSMSCKKSENTESNILHDILFLQVNSAAGTSSYLKSSTNVKPSHSNSNGMPSKASNEDILNDDPFVDDVLDDDLFEDDVLSLIDDVESQFGSQPVQSQPLQLSQSPKSKCTLDEIARKKEEAQRRRKESTKMETKIQSRGKQNDKVSNVSRMCEDFKNTRENTNNVGEFSERKCTEEQRIDLMSTAKQKKEKNDGVISQQLPHQENKNVVWKKEVIECQRMGSIIRQELNRGIEKVEESLKVVIKRKEKAACQASEWKKQNDIAMSLEAAQQKEQIARKKEEAIRRREERLRSRQQTSFNSSVR